MLNNRSSSIVGVGFLVVVCLLLGRWWGLNSGQADGAPPIFVNCSPTELGFTCSMHPKFRVTTAGKCPFCQMPLIRELVLPGQQLSQIALSEEAAALADIQTVVLDWSENTGRKLELVGKIAVDHGRKFIQVASLPGRIEALYAQRPGQWIKKGQPIARIYSKELIAAVEAFRRPNTPESVRLSARNNLRDWQVPDTTFDRLVNAEDHRQAVDIYASASGMVSTLHAHVGEQAVNTIMGAPTRLYSLVDISVVWIELALYERDLKNVRKGQMLHIAVDAFPGEEFRAKIISLSTEVDDQSRTLTVIAELANPNLRLRPGMLARAVLNADKAVKPQLLIPKSAVLWTGKRSVVYVKDTSFDQAVFHFREIIIGDMSADQVEVISGLEPGEELVINGVFSIDAAAQLQGKHSMINMPKDL